jgi:hypothetical protein
MRIIMYSLILTLLTISCTYTGDIIIREEILDYLESDQFFGFETLDNIYVIQFDSATNVIDEFRLADSITFSGKILSLSYGDTSIKITTEKDISANFEAVGIITITKGDDLPGSFSDIFNNLKLSDVGDCWTGGPGSLACSTGQKSASITVNCSTGYYSCCHRSIIGTCVSSNQ